MKNKNANISATVSQVLTAILLLVMGAAAFTMPLLVKWYSKLTGRSDIDMVLVIVLMYIALIPAFTAVISLWKILTAVKRGDVFTSSSVSLLRLISWCAFAESAVFAVLATQFMFSFAIAFAGVFIGIVLRVIKNVIQTATEIKEENDYTI